VFNAAAPFDCDGEAIGVPDAFHALAVPVLKVVPAASVIQTVCMVLSKAHVPPPSGDIMTVCSVSVLACPALIVNGAGYDLLAVLYVA